MEIKVLEKEKDKLKFEIEGEDNTFSNILRSELWNDKNVTISGYQIAHSLLSEPIFTLESSNPKTSLLNAAKRLSKLNDDLKEKFKKTIK